MKKYFMIMSIALCCITGSSCFAQDTMSEEQKTAYGNILWQFWDAIQSNGSSEHLIEESVVNYVFLRYPIREDRQLAFSVTDMNEDGSMELMIGYQDTASVVNLFSFKDGKVVQLLEAMEERWYTNFCANGWLDYEGSGGAAYHSSIYYSIGQDGKSLIAEEYYSINGEENYVEDLEGNYIQFNGESDQYMEKYEMQIPAWIPLTYDNISEVTVPYENAGERLTVYDIPVAPQFQNGVCTNGEEVLIRYKKSHISRDISENWRCEYNYEEYGEEVQTYQIKGRQTNNLISIDVANLRTGEVEETDARSGEVRRFNMFDLTSDSIEIIEGADAESYDYREEGVKLQDIGKQLFDNKLYVYCIASEYATLRETPSTSARAITTIPSRDEAEYLSEDGVFYYVKYNGMKGYVLKDFFSIDKNANLNYGNGSSYGGTLMALYCRASEYATLRETPSTSANALTTIPSRGAVEYLGEDGSFYYVKYNGMRGYVLKDFFSFDRNASLNYGDGSSYSFSTSTMNLYCRASEYATLRETPSTSAYALTTVPSRGVVEYLGVNGAFYYVRYNGMTGYVLQDFFSSDRNASLNYGDGSNYGSSATTLYCKASEFATLRSYASVDATALAKVYSREAVQYLGDSGDFYYVSYRGAKGYVLKNYFSTNPSAELNYGTS